MQPLWEIMDPPLAILLKSLITDESIFALAFCVCEQTLTHKKNIIYMLISPFWALKSAAQSIDYCTQSVNINHYPL